MNVQTRKFIVRLVVGCIIISLLCLVFDRFVMDIVAVLGG